MVKNSYFSRSTTRFLSELSDNNNREWFAENKHQYESAVLDPALQFIGSMAEPLAKIAPEFRAVAKRSGGSLMRVYRDTRFGNDKTPYKTNIGIQFRHKLGKDVHAPGYYVHIEPANVFIGVGVWRPASPMLAAIRDHIVEDPEVWRKLSRQKRFTSRFRLSGDCLKRAPRGFDENHPLIDDLKRKDFIAVRELSPGAAASPDFRDVVLDTFRAADGFMRFLCAANNISF